MAMNNSFYGGRRGASFVIVKNYLDIPSMTADFAQGNSFTEVAFDEYVIINNPNKNHPDNGKIFRRGYDYNSNRKIEAHSNASGPAVEIEAHGAEYIGTIIGPAGKAPLLTMGAYDEVKELGDSAFDERRSKGHYSPIVDTQRIQQEQEDTNTWREGPELNNNTISLVPGKYENNGQIKYNDSIEWCCVSIRNDDLYDDTQAYIGFKFPYLVTQMQTSSVEPYNTNGNIADMSDIFRASDDDETHPYYNKWHLNIPKGVKGDTFKNLKVMSFSDYNNQFAPNDTTFRDKLRLFNSVTVTIPGSDPEQTEQTDLYYNVYIRQKLYDLLQITNKNQLTENDLIEKARLQSELDEARNGKLLIYEDWNYDNKQSGQVTYYYLGDYNQIDNIQTQDGKLIISFTHDETKEFPLNYVKEVRINNNGYLEFEYASGTIQPFQNIKWIKRVNLDTSIKRVPETGEPYYEFNLDDNGNLLGKGQLTVTYNDDSTETWLIPTVSRVDYEQNGNLSYSLLGDADSRHLTTIKYVKNIIQGKKSGAIFIIYNTYDYNRPLDSENPNNGYLNPEYPQEGYLNTLKELLEDKYGINNQEELENISRAIDVYEYDVFPIKAISKIQMVDDKIMATYTTGDSPEEVGTGIFGISMFGFDSVNHRFCFQKTGEEQITYFDLDYPISINYDATTDTLKYNTTKGNQVIIDSLPFIKSIDITDNLDFYVQMNPNFSFVDNIINETSPSYYDDSHKKEQKWIHLANLAKNPNVLGVYRNFNLEQIKSIINTDSSFAVDNFPENQDPFQILRTNNMYTNNSEQINMLSIIITFLNIYYPNGRIEGEYFRAITVGDSDKSKQFYAYDEHIQRNEGVMGSWFYLGEIVAAEKNVVCDYKNGTEVNNLVDNGIILTKTGDICDITISSDNNLKVSNPMTKIKYNSSYYNKVTNADLTGLEIEILMGKVLMTVDPETNKNVFDPLTREINISKVTGDIEIALTSIGG